MSNRTGGRRTKAAATAATLIAALVLGLAPDLAASQANPSASAGERPKNQEPVDTQGTDPVLDEVPVDDTPALRRTDGKLVALTAAQDRATLRWLDSDAKRQDLASRAGEAGALAAEAQSTLDDARADEAAKTARLEQREEVEASRKATLNDRQDELRELAAQLYATAPEDRYALLGSLADMTEADRRDQLRDQGSEFQIERVLAARKPWITARQERVFTQGQVRQAEFITKISAQASQEAIDERDRSDQLVQEAEDQVRAAIAEVDAARMAAREVIVDRRLARLESTVRGLDLPLVALDAYWRASSQAPCRVPWWVIAGIGRVESGHGSAQQSSLTGNGDTTTHIRGIALDGRPGTAAIRDSDGGLLDDDGTWDRAVGPMQFIPGTWGRWAVDGNADGETSPHNIYDAAGAAARYLCYGRGDLNSEAKIRTALLSYNRSNPYGTEVLAKGGRYRDALDLPEVPANTARD